MDTNLTIDCLYWYMDTYVTLSESQQQKATELVSIVESKNAVVPADLLNRWEPAPETQRTDWSTETRWVSPDNIIGTVPMNVDRFVSARALKHLERLQSGEFEAQFVFPPSLKQVEGELYVDADGNHRSIIFKFLGIERMWAEIVVYK